MQILAGVLFLLQAIPYSHAIIDLPEAHEIITGTRSVVIAILDTGIDSDHPEFSGRILDGYDFINDDDDPEDDHGHGTMMASAAAGSNMGICPGCSILPVKVLNQSNFGSWDSVSNGIIFAADHGADVINMSLASVETFSSLEFAVSYAYEHGVTMVAAGGNRPLSDPPYPALYHNVYGVSSTGQNDVVSDFVVPGPHVFVAAPGEGVPVAILDGYYDTENGTSLSTAYVSGLAGLLLSQDETRSTEAVMSIVAATAKDLGPCGRDAFYGYGRIDTAAAVRAGTATLPEEGRCLAHILFFPVMHHGKT